MIPASTAPPINLVPGTVAVHFSGAASYLVVCQKANFSGAKDGKNLSVWELSTGVMVVFLLSKDFQ